MSSRRQRSIPLGCRYRQVSLYYRSLHVVCYSGSYFGGAAERIKHDVFWIKLPDIKHNQLQQMRQNDGLTHWDRVTHICVSKLTIKMDAVSQTTFSNAFSWTKISWTRISIKFSLKFVPKGPINNNPSLVQAMAWRRSGDKPLSEPMMVI